MSFRQGALLEVSLTWGRGSRGALGWMNKHTPSQLCHQGWLPGLLRQLMGGGLLGTSKAAECLGVFAETPGRSQDTVLVMCSISCLLPAHRMTHYPDFFPSLWLMPILF